MTQYWHTPKDRNLYLLDQIRSKLNVLNFDIPNELFQNVPDEVWAKHLMDSLVQLQHQVQRLTSQEQFHRQFYQHIKNSDNRLRGRWGEFVARIYLHTLLLIPYDKIEHDKRTFSTPYGLRRIDCYGKKRKIIVEVKAAYITARRSNIRQIQKDLFLLRSGAVNSAVWILLGDGSARVKEQLRISRIESILPSDPKLTAIYDLFNLITLTDTPEGEVMSIMDKLFMLNMPEK
jgi:hypothetical protein